MNKKTMRLARGAKWGFFAANGESDGLASDSEDNMAERARFPNPKAEDFRSQRLDSKSGFTGDSYFK
jgi:hypothetical protein